jgi:ferritin-like metal-binding protein YciE
MEITDFRSLYNGWLLDIKSLESQLVDALPAVADAATDAKLKQAITHHLQQTRGHLDRAERLLESLGGETKGPECQAMKGLIKEVKEIIDEVEDKEVLNAAIIGAAQKVEHYEMATYGTAITFAKMLGLNDHARELQMTLDEEYAADKTLSEIAMTGVNKEALTAMR